MSDQLPEFGSMEELFGAMDQAANKPEVPQTNEEPSVPEKEPEPTPEPIEEPVESPEEELETAPQPEEGDSPVEWISVTDDVTGKRKKIKVDFSDKDKIRQVYAKAAGLIPKYQRERDELKAKLDDSSKPIEAFNKLNSAFEQQGIKGVIQLLSGGDESAIEAFIQEELNHRDWLRNASPDEVEALELKERLKKAEEERKNLLERMEQEKAEIEEKTRTAKEQEMQNKLASSFSRWKFSDDEAGSPEAAVRLNKITWRQALDDLSASGNENPTKRDIDKAFKEAANFLRNQVSTQTKSRTSEVLNKKKANAQRKVAQAASTNSQASSAKSKAQDIAEKKGIQGLINSLWGD